MPHVIQVPGTGVSGHQHPEDIVGFDCEVDLKFQKQGDFWRSNKGDEFTPKMSEGPVTAGLETKCTSPHKALTVNWKFTAASNGSVTTGKIKVKKNAGCK